MRHAQGLKASAGGGGWSLARMQYTGALFRKYLSEVAPTASNSTVSHSIAIDDDGLRLYIVEGIGNSNCIARQYNFLTPWDVTSLQYHGSRTLTASQFLDAIYFKPDGLRMFASFRNLSTFFLATYTLGTAWDITTATLLVTSNGIQVGQFPKRGLFSSPDGLKFFLPHPVNSPGGRSLNTYTVPTPWLTDSITLGQQVTLNDGESLEGMWWNSNGLDVYNGGGRFITASDGVATEGGLSYDSSFVSKRTPTTAWTYDGLTAAATNLTIGSGRFGAFWIKPDLTKMYFFNGWIMEQFNIITTGNFTTTKMPNSTKFFQINGTQILSIYNIFFKDDGTKMYTIDGGVSSFFQLRGIINEYNLSSPWDLSNVTFANSLSVEAQSGRMSGLFFRPDGLKMYTVAWNTDSIYEYNLSTAWNVTTASLLRTLSVSAQVTGAYLVYFSSDGLIMYTANTNGGLDSGTPIKHQYSLSTAWNISTATFVKSVTNIGGYRGFYIRPDGKKLYTSAGEYDLSIPWDIGTATFVTDFSFRTKSHPSYSHQPDIVTGIFFKDNGKRIFIADASAATPTKGTVWSYDL